MARTNSNKKTTMIANTTSPRIRGGIMKTVIKPITKIKTPKALFGIHSSKETTAMIPTTETYNALDSKKENKSYTKQSDSEKKEISYVNSLNNTKIASALISSISTN